MVGFSPETINGKQFKVWNTFNVSKGYQWRILYPDNLPFQNEGKMKTFPNKCYWENSLTAEVPNKNKQTKKLLKKSHRLKGRLPDSKRKEGRALEILNMWVNIKDWLNVVFFYLISLNKTVWSKNHNSVNN